MRDKTLPCEMNGTKERNFYDSLLVVMVVYKMKLAESPTYQSLTRTLATSHKSLSLFVYDNSPHPQSMPLVANWEITYHHNLTNPGVSKAYNEGFNVAKAQGKKWLLLADQDTAFPENIFDLYKRCVQEFGVPIVVPLLTDHKGVVSPLKFYSGGGQRQKKLLGSIRLSLKEYLFHNSGLLVSTEVFEKANGYDEHLPLDFSDFSFVHRLRKENLFFALSKITCAHHLATTSSATLQERLARFESYLKAGSYFNKNYLSSRMILPVRLFLRAVKLTFQCRSFQFMFLYFRTA